VTGMGPLRLRRKITQMGCGQLPIICCRHGVSVDILKRLRRPQPASRLYLSVIMSPEAMPSAHPDKPGRLGAGSSLAQFAEEVMITA